MYMHIINKLNVNRVPYNEGTVKISYTGVWPINSITNNTPGLKYCGCTETALL